MYSLEKKIVLPITLKESWDFFSNPFNLPKITPGKLNFKITSDILDKIYPGMIINYKVTPLLGIPLSWTTEITHCIENELFVDEQRFGPYKFWHHQHHFSEVDGGVLVHDIVNYKITFGSVFPFINSFIVRKQLDEIFDYREKVLTELFIKSK